MKGILWVIVLLVISPSLYADSIPVFNITSATILFTVNSGSGDNASFGLSGPGTVVFGEGSAGCNWCFAGTTFQPGQSLNGSVPFVGVDFMVSIQLGGQTLDVNSTTLGSTSLLAGSFLFPTDPQTTTFTVAVPAQFSGPLLGSSSQFPIFGLKIPAGKLFLTFDSSGRQFLFSQGVYFATTPEPGTLIMVASGLLAMGTLVYRRRCCGRFTVRE